MTVYYVVRFLQGPAGPSGGYTTANPPVYFHATGIVPFNGAIQIVGLNTSVSGAFGMTLGSAPLGTILQVDDYMSTWQAAAPWLITQAGIYIENPNGGAKMSNQAMFMPSYSGAPTTSYTWTMHLVGTGEGAYLLWKYT